MNHFKSMLMGVAILFALPVFFTSCVKVDNPMPVKPDVPLPTPDPHAAMKATPLTLEAAVAGVTVTFTINTAAAPNPVEYCTDGKTWTAYTSEAPIELSAVGDKVMFRATNATYSDGLPSTFFCSDDCYLYGNIMSLVNKDNFQNETEFTADRTFEGLFFYSSKIKNHTDATKYLILPATKLKAYSYANMFSGCSSLTTTPVFNADCDGKQNGLIAMFLFCSALTTVAEGSQIKGAMGSDCCNMMFSGCTSLTTVPADFLPSTDLATSCYQSMFDRCLALVKAPKLPATALATNCYWGMFWGCTSLDEAWVKAEYSADCYKMFFNCPNAATNKFHTDGTQAAWTAELTNLSSWQFDAYPTE